MLPSKGTKSHSNLTKAIQMRVDHLVRKGYSRLDAAIKAGAEYGVVTEQQHRDFRLI